MSNEIIISKAAIAGVITDAVTGSPLTGAVVQITGSKLSCETRNNGLYFFVNLPAGSYSMTVQMPNAGSRYGQLSISGVTVSTTAKGTPRFDTKANIALTPTCIQGTVRRTDGIAIAGAVISVVGSDIFTVSATDGTFTLTGLYEGKPNVQISAVNFKTVVKSTTLHAGTITHMNVNLES